MRLKSFTAKTLPEAMRQVREAFGPEAVILSSQPSESGKGVRITAALEDGGMDEFDLGGAGGGLGSIDEISEALTHHRVPPGLFDRLIGVAATLPSPDVLMTLAGALDSELAFAPLPEHDSTTRPIMLIGPPGAGKTATAAKLCARARLAGGKISLITMDTVKSGGLAQVSAFARVLEARLEPVEDIDGLSAAVEACPDGHFVVIDTTGANPFDDGDVSGLERAADVAGAEPILVLSAGGDPADSAEIALAFARTGARRLIATKLDIARRFGGILSAAQAGGMALMAAGMSPNIGDGLMPINPVALARLFLPGWAASEQTGLARETA